MKTFDYGDMNVLSEFDYGDMDVLSEFDEGKSMSEGVSGRKRINTRYENTAQSTIQHPRSENSDDAMTESYSH